MEPDIITDLGIADIITRDQLLTDMGYTIIHSPVGVSLTESVMAGLATAITELHIITHHGGDQPDTVTVTDMATTMVITADITEVIIMVIIMGYIRAAVQDIVQGTMTDTIRQTARIYIRAGQLV
jgi:hypothetical protein